MPENPQRPFKGLANIKQVLRSFSSRNYRLFFTGQGISLIGTWMQKVAMQWLVYSLTGSAYLLGLMEFGGQIPILFIAPFAGVLADRFSKRRLLILTQSLSMLQAFALTYLVFSGKASFPFIMGLNILLGVANGFDVPIRQSFVVEMIEKKEDLGNAIALNSSLFNSARFIGPSLAGMVIKMLGEGLCFLFNGISFIPVIWAFWAMKVPAQKIAKKGGRVLQELSEGFHYVRGFKPLRDILLYLFFIGMMGMPYVVLMPVVAKDVLQGGPHTYGFLIGSTGVGAFLGAVLLASRKNAAGLEKIIPLASACFGIFVIAFSFSRNLWLSSGLLVLAGICMITQIASCNTLTQTLADDDKRGRVMSFYTMAFIGSGPFGALMMGSVASKIGTPHTILGAGLCSLLGAVVFYSRLPEFRRLVRHVYIKKGLIEDIAEVEVRS